MATATLSSNSDVCGPITLLKGQTGSYHIVVTGTITVTIQRSVGALGFVNVNKPDGNDAAFTTSETGLIEGPGSYQLIASGVSGGSAACALTAE